MVRNFLCLIHLLTLRTRTQKSFRVPPHHSQQVEPSFQLFPNPSLRLYVAKPRCGRILEKAVVQFRQSLDESLCLVGKIFPLDIDRRELTGRFFQ